MRSIASFIHRCTAEGAFPGAVWIVGNKDVVLETGCAGVLGAGLGSVRPDSIYDIASLTKIFVTLALMRQMEDGLIRMEDTAGFFLPQWRGAPKAHITIKELLTHTSAMPSLTGLYRYAPTRGAMLEAIRLCPPRADSPDRVLYTCEGYILLGEIIAAIDTLPLDEVIVKRVLEPLGMKDTCYRPPPILRERIAAAEQCPWRARLLRGEVHDENAFVMGSVSGNAGIFSTAADLAGIAAFMLGSGNADGFLQTATVNMMIRNYTAGRGQNRGLGWLLAGPGSPAGDIMPADSFGHTGFTGTSIWIDPVSGIYGVLLSNRVHPSRDNGKIFRVREIFHNLIALNYGR
ncbi:MAG: beta-lactamase family protein [Treponema sp.]|jgi:CubicO group peptidase (beta-lactamase class C family)|nr:beta-lactamase family protein [Treponema sp.]